jgi:hypothetical protein
MTSSVGLEFPKELARCQSLVELYRSMGPTGAFAAATTQRTIEEADEAWRSGDVVRIVAAFKAMKECE